jgi:hypothetical protein
MPFHRIASETNVVDVLDHVLDKGIVVDAWMRVSIAGIDLIGVEARIVVASISTYLGYASAVAESAQLFPETLIAPPRRRRPIEEQLQRIRDQRNTSGATEGLESRGIDEGILDDIRDAHARTVRRRKQSRRAVD